MTKNSPKKVPLTKQYRMVLSAVHMVYRLVNSTYNLKELCLRLTRLLCQFIHAHSASIIVLDAEKHKPLLVAIFNNKINILLDKKKDFAQITEREMKVTEGYIVFEKRLIGIPLVAEDNIGAIFVKRANHEKAFDEYDKEMLSVFAEQSVTAIKNLQLNEQQQKIILSSIKFIDKLLKKQSQWRSHRTPAYFSILKALAEKMNMRQEGIECLYYASILHDAGAIDIPFELLTKTSRLTSEEFKVIKDLPAKSVELIKPVEFLRPVLPIILYHRERYDGSGYPSGLRQKQIPLGARIMAVVDAYEAMIKGRPYKKELSSQEAFKELKRNAGTQFDPEVVNAFISLSKQKKNRKNLSNLK